MRRTLSAAALAIAALALVPGAAGAASRVSLHGADLRIQADDAQRHVISVTERSAARVAVRDAAGIRAGRGCVQRGPRLADCRRPRRLVDATLGSAGDVLEFSYKGRIAIDAGAGDDRITGRAPSREGSWSEIDPGAGDDLVHAGPGRSLVLASAGADRMFGGAGEDQLTYERRTAPLTLTLDGLANDGEQGEGDLIGGDFEALFGGAGGDVIVGSGRAEQLAGLGGDDTVTGQGGGDSLYGGDGNDTIFAFTAQDADDGELDWIFCGDGEDKLLAAASDRVGSVARCES